MVRGPNGHGKTSFLEALLYARVFRSFRGSRDAELVRFGEAGFHLESGRVAVGFDARSRAKRITVDGSEPERLLSAIGLVRGVVISPSDVELVAAGPRARRQFLDVLLALTVRGYVEALARYRRALKHRVRATAGEMPVWERALVDAGGRLIEARSRWAGQWRGRYAEVCRAAGEDGQASLSYQPSVEVDRLAATLEKSRERDVARGRTSAGPHRDDLRLELDGRDLRTYGSAGQQRTAAIALRLVEAESSSAGTVCLDDAFAELDGARSERLGALIEDLADRGVQVIAAVPRDGDVPPVLVSLPRWAIRHGALTR